MLDVSGSMGREYSVLNVNVTKLDLAKSCVLHLIESYAAPQSKRLLTERDYVSVVCAAPHRTTLLSTCLCHSSPLTRLFCFVSVLYRLRGGGGGGG